LFDIVVASFISLLPDCGTLHAMGPEIGDCCTAYVGLLREPQSTYERRLYRVVDYGGGVMVLDDGRPETCLDVQRPLAALTPPAAQAAGPTVPTSSRQGG
jgi:hypothetical protein